jgi:hypothetical protein
MGVVVFVQQHCRPEFGALTHLQDPSHRWVDFQVKHSVHVISFRVFAQIPNQSPWIKAREDQQWKTPEHCSVTLCP